MLVLGVTANAPEDDRQLCLQAGMTEELTKPSTLQQLAAQLKRVIMTAPNFPPAVRREALARLRSEIGDEIFDEVVAVYLEETPIKVARIIEAAASGDLASVASAAHGLRSTSGTLGADGLAEVAESIETHARSNRLAETQAHVANLSALYREVECVLRAEGLRP